MVGELLIEAFVRVWVFCAIAIGASLCYLILQK